MNNIQEKKGEMKQNGLIEKLKQIKKNGKKYHLRKF